MSLKLRTNEKLIAMTKIHWSTYIMPVTFSFLLIGIPFLMYRILANNCQTRAITNQRLYLENGILAKTRVDISLDKINDITFSQSLFDRILGTGKIFILTGNDTTNLIKDLDNPQEFYEKITSAKHGG